MVYRRVTSMIFAAASFLALCVLLQGCGGQTKNASENKTVTASADGESVLADAAASISLARKEGAVSVSDGAEKEMPVAEGMLIYDNYRVCTETQSYAWMNLDDTKLVKMDVDSLVRTALEGKKLQLWLDSGSLFFNITRPLQDDESLEIRTSSMVTGIRGTVGWVYVPDAEHMDVYILEGKVECGAGDEVSKPVAEGEVARMSTEQGNSTIVVDRFKPEDVPDFVRTEIDSDSDLRSRIDPSLYEIPEGPQLSDDQLQLLQQLSGLCEAGDYDSIFTIIHGEEYQELINTVEAVGEPYIETDNGKGIGLYTNLSPVVIYYGDYADGQRQGNGLWIGGSNILDFYYTGQWSGDMPNGEQTEWWHHFESGTIGKLVGTVINGVWDGPAVEGSSVNGSPMSEDPVTFDHGKYVILRVDENGEYVVSEGEMSTLSIVDPDEFSAIIGFGE